MGECDCGAGGLIAQVGGDHEAGCPARGEWPEVAGIGEETDETLLREAEDALHSISLRLLGVSPRLQEPYTDAPELSPWTHTIGPQARRAHDLSMAIRKHLGLPYRHPTRALGTPPLEAEDLITPAMLNAGAQAIADAERDLAGSAIRRYPVSWRRTVALAVLKAALTSGDQS